KLARLVTRLAPALDELAVAIELADPLILAEFADVIEAVPVLHDVADIAELPWLRAADAANGFQFLSFRRIDAERVIVGIADNEVIVGVDAQAAGPAVAVIRRGPGWAEVLAVAVIDLDAGREINDIKTILFVDGNSSRPHQVAVLHAFLAPDYIRGAV